jgi:hypothetical protein
MYSVSVGKKNVSSYERYIIYADNKVNVSDHKKVSRLSLSGSVRASADEAAGG